MVDYLTEQSLLVNAELNLEVIALIDKVGKRSLEAVNGVWGRGVGDGGMYATLPDEAALGHQLHAWRGHGTLDIGGAQLRQVLKAMHAPYLGSVVDNAVDKGARQPHDGAEVLAQLDELGRLHGRRWLVAEVSKAAPVVSVEDAADGEHGDMALVGDELMKSLEPLMLVLIFIEKTADLLIAADDIGAVVG